MDRYDLLKADVESHLDIIDDNLTNMESCFEILIPKNDFTGDDLDFDALLRGEVTEHQKRDDSYKEVRNFFFDLKMNFVINYSF